MFRPWFRSNRLLYKLWEVGRDPQARYGVRAGSRWPWTSDTPIAPLHFPFIMAYAVSYLRKHHINASLIDAVAQEQHSYRDFMRDVRAASPDIVVIETSTPTFDIDIWLAEQIAAFSEVALAGSHLTYHAEMAGKQYPFVTYLLKGEYIQSALRMAQKRTPGIYESQVVENLDSIPYPYRDYPEATQYFDHTMPTPKPQLQLYGSKGCPFRCTFCLWPQTMFMRNVALRSPHAIAREIREVTERYGYKSLFFDDDTFNIGVDRISALCDELKNIGLPWTMMGRLDTSPDWLFDKMVDSGCVGMRFGVETFDTDVLKRVGKGLERSDFKKTIRRLSKKYPDVMLRLFTMMDLPGQSRSMHEKDMKILADMGFSENGNIYRQVQVSQCAPFPGTVMYEQLKHTYGEKALENTTLYDGGRDTVMAQLTRKIASKV